MQNRGFTAFCLVIMPPKRPVFVGLLHGVTVVARKPHIFCGGAGHWRLAQNCPERVRPFPTNSRKVRYNWGNANFRQVCRGRIYASRAVCPLGCITGMIARAEYMPPLQSTRIVVIAVKPRAGLAPPLRGSEFCMLRQPQGGKEGSRFLPNV